MLAMASVACSGGASASPSAAATPSESPVPAPTATALATTTPTAATSPATFSLAQAALKVVRRFELALILAQSSGEITGADYRAYEPHLNILRLSLGDGSITLARTDYDGLARQIATDAAKLRGTYGSAAQRVFQLLGSVLAAKPLVVGPLGPGSASTSGFLPGVLVTLPAGWSATADGATAASFTKGGVTLTFDHSASAITAEAVTAALTQAGAVATSAPTKVMAADYAGWSGTAAKAGDGVRVWVLEANHRPLTIRAEGPRAAFDALAGEIAAILAKLVVA